MLSSRPLQTQTSSTLCYNLKQPWSLKVSGNRSFDPVVVPIGACEGLKATAPVRGTIGPVIIGRFHGARAVGLGVEVAVAVIVGVAIGDVGAVGVCILIVVVRTVWRVRDIDCVVRTAAIVVVVDLYVLADSQGSGGK
jgi:hypothetical protein